jgi:hypothetical protein
MQLKPVLSSKELLDKYHSGIDLYAIPDTHRIVPVELLESAMSVFSVEGFDKEADQLRAIIDKEPT